MPIWLTFDWGIKMLKPSKRHFLRYDAQKYEKEGFIEVAGKVQQLAQKPRFWQVTADLSWLGNRSEERRVGKECRL